MRTYDINYDRICEKYDVRCLLRFFKAKNCVRYNKINPQSSLHYSFDVPKNLILSKIIQKRFSFSQIYELITTFFSSIRNITYEHYRKQPMSMCKIKLHQILSRNLILINCLNRNTSHPLIRRY